MKRSYAKSLKEYKTTIKLDEKRIAQSMKRLKKSRKLPLARLFTIGVLPTLLFAAQSKAENERRIVHTSGGKLEYQIRKNEKAGTLEIRYENFDPKKADLTKEPWSFHPELKRNQPFIVSLSPDDLSGWGKLNLMDRHILQGAISDVKKFMREHRNSLLKLRNAAVDQIDFEGKPIEMNARLYDLTQLADRLEWSPDFERWQMKMEGGLKPTIDKTDYLKPSPDGQKCVIDRPTLIITHAEGGWTDSESARTKINSLVSQFKAKGDVLYLYSDTGKPWFAKDVPTFAIRCPDGGNNIQVDYPEVAIAGGNFGLCQGLSMKSAIQNRNPSLRKRENLTIHIPMEAVYLGDSTLDEFHENLKTHPRAFTLFVMNALFNLPQYPAIGFCGVNKLVEDHSFTLFLDGNLMAKQVGSGEDRVLLKFWSTNRKYLDGVTKVKPAMVSEPGAHGPKVEP